MWPAIIVQRLQILLPEEYTAEPRVHVSPYIEVDICAFEGNESAKPAYTAENEEEGVATAKWAPPSPTHTVDANLQDQYE